MDRPVQVGDYAQLIFPDEVQTYPIELIDGENIYVTIIPGESIVLVPRGDRYQVQGLNLSHEIEFFSPSLTGVEFIDLLILQELDDKSLKTACQVDDYISNLCNGDQLWIDKITSKYGQVNRKPLELRSKAYYFSLHYPLSVGGANLAVARNDRVSLERLIRLGFYPNIQNPNRYPDLLDQPPTGDIIPHSKISEDMISFLREAELGPQVTGGVQFTGTFGDVKFNSIELIEGTRFNDLLYFIHPEINGQPNPLYRIVGFLHSIYDIFLLHDKYAHMKNRSRRYSASSTMRKYLGRIMQKTIDQDVNAIKRMNPKYARSIELYGKQHKEAINDPTAVLTSRYVIEGRVWHIFNPNNFKQEYFSDIFSSSVSRRIDDRRISGYRVAQVYSAIPDITPINAIGKVFRIENRVVALANSL